MTRSDCTKVALYSSVFCPVQVHSVVQRSLCPYKLKATDRCYGSTQTCLLKGFRAYWTTNPSLPPPTAPPILHQTPGTSLCRASVSALLYSPMHYRRFSMDMYWPKKLLWSRKQRDYLSLCWENYSFSFFLQIGLFLSFYWVKLITVKVIILSLQPKELVDCRK